MDEIVTLTVNKRELKILLELLCDVNSVNIYKRLKSDVTIDEIVELHDHLETIYYE